MLKAPSFEGAFSIFVTGQKKSASNYFLETRRYRSMLGSVMSMSCA